MFILLVQSIQINKKRSITVYCFISLFFFSTSLAFWNMLIGFERYLFKIRVHFFLSFYFTFSFCKMSMVSKMAIMLLKWNRNIFFQPFTVGNVFCLLVFLLFVKKIYVWEQREFLMCGAPAKSEMRAKTWQFDTFSWLLVICYFKRICMFAKIFISTWGSSYFIWFHWKCSLSFNFVLSWCTKSRK